MKPLVPVLTAALLLALSGAAGAAIAIHDAAETLREHCHTDAEGRLWLEAGGFRFELIASIDDPAIPNRGDGRFHPFDPAEVRAALDAVRFPLEGIDAHVYLLPAPRRRGFESAAAPGLILLAPGVREVAREHQHAEVVHELGHVVHHARLPDHDVAGWARYRGLRGITGGAYVAGAAHADRPHEIFAEDFRYLFGGALANHSGSIENAALALPDQVAGLADFFAGLAGATPPVLAATPNPSRGAVEFHGPARVRAPLDVFDAAGRRVATLAPEPRAEGTRWRWAPRAGASGVLFARLRDGSGAVRFTRLD